MQLALASSGEPAGGRFRLPPAVPPFSTRTYRIFSVIWIFALLLALVGPAMGIYYRYSAPDNNSQLMLGSRASFAASHAASGMLTSTTTPASRRLPSGLW